MKSYKGQYINVEPAHINDKMFVGKWWVKDPEHRIEFLLEENTVPCKHKRNALRAIKRIIDKKTTEPAD